MSETVIPARARDQETYAASSFRFGAGVCASGRRGRVRGHRIVRFARAPRRDYALVRAGAYVLVEGVADAIARAP